MAKNFNIIPVFFLRHPRDFDNEYVIGIATTSADADQYRVEGYKEIERDDALAMMSRRENNSETLWVTVEMNGEPVENRFMLAREIRRERGMWEPTISAS